MAFWDSWFKKKSSSQSIYETPRVYEENFQDATRQLIEGYEWNAIVYRCISEIARCAAELDVEVVDAEGNYIEQETEAYLLLENPNNYQIRDDFLEAVFINHLATGSAYIEGVYVGNKIKELHIIPSHQMTIETYSGSPYYAHTYRWTPDNGQMKTWRVNQVTGAIENENSKIFHFKKFNPRQPKEGLSPLKAGGRATDLSNSVLEWNNSLLDNMGKTAGILKTEQVLADPVFERLKQYLAGFTGKSKAGKTPILEAGLEWQQTGLTPVDMDFEKSLTYADKYIGSVFGVPVDLLLGSATFNNADVAREQLYLNTIIPLVNQFLKRFALFVNPREKQGLRVNEEDVPALEPLRQRKFDRLIKARKDKILTVNEIRSELGYDEVDDPEANELFGMSFGDTQGNANELEALTNAQAQRENGQR